MSAKRHQCALKSDTVNSTVQQLLSLFLARALLGWDGRGGSQSVPGGRLFPSRKGVSVVLTVPPLGLCRELHFHLNVPHQPQALPQTPALLQTMCSKHCTLLAITVLHKCLGIWKALTHSSSPTPQSAPARSISTDKIHTKLRRCGRHRPWTPLGVTKVLLLCWSIIVTWSAQQTTKQSSPTAAQLSTLMASYPPP